MTRAVLILVLASLAFAARAGAATVAMTVARLHRRPLALGSARFDLAAGERRTARFRLRRTARRVLRGVPRPLLALRLEARTLVGADRHPLGPSPDIGAAWRVRL